MYQATSSKVELSTVDTSMRRLRLYADWLEAEELDWRHFPEREGERCVYRYRGALIRKRDAGEISPSNCTHRMGVVIRFYRWLAARRLIVPDRPMWVDKPVGIKRTDKFGVEHTLNVLSSDIAIPNRTVAGLIKVEGGVLPLSLGEMREILDFADEEASEELRLMLRLGFQTGLRLGSVCDLKVVTLLRSSRDHITGWHHLVVGPGARPSVKTKYGVTGKVPIPSALLDHLKSYATSTRRLKREALARETDRHLLFLTRYGEPFSSAEFKAVNVAMSRLRKKAFSAGVRAFTDFYFHRTRATFATEAMRCALKVLPVDDAVDFVRTSCLHKDDATTFRYIKLIRTGKAMETLADEFSKAMMGLAMGTTRRA